MVPIFVHFNGLIYQLTFRLKTFSLDAFIPTNKDDFDR